MQDTYHPPADVAVCPYCAATVPRGGVALPALWRCLACGQEWHEVPTAEGVTRYWAPAAGEPD